MNIKINPSLQWGAVFQVPAAVVDKHLKLASPEQLKALLWVLRHASDLPELSELCAVLRCDAGDAEDYLKFWVERGILLCDDTKIVHPPSLTVISTADEHPQTPKKAPLEPIPLINPTSEQILARAKESFEIAFLFNEAQKKLGRTVGYDTQCVLLMLHDQYGLPVEVILMIIEYCVSVGKISVAYISAMGKDWAEKEIDTIEKADEQVELLRRCNGVWKELATLAGIANPRPTAVQSEFLRTWTFEFSFGVEMLYLAYEEMANHCTKLSFAYMNKVLKNWHDAGYKTPIDVADAAKKYADSKSGGKKGASNPADAKIPHPAKNAPSYDIEEYKRAAMQDPIVYKKKKKANS